MSRLQAEGEALFAENGYLIRRDVLRPDQIQQAVDALWHYIDTEPSSICTIPAALASAITRVFDLTACMARDRIAPLRTHQP